MGIHPEVDLRHDVTKLDHTTAYARQHNRTRSPGIKGFQPHS